ncbi:MAG: hypothetical protein ACOH5I_17910 [Oligoflexus sp.]
MEKRQKTFKYLPPGPDALIEEDRNVMVKIANEYFKILIVFSMIALVACDEEEVDQRRLSSWRSADLEVKNGPDIRIHLPQRQDIISSDLAVEELLNSYYLKLVPEGQLCKDDKVIEVLAPYEDQATLELASQRLCDYRLELLVGYSDPQILASVSSQAAMNSPINYQDHIQVIVQQQCLTCHPDYDTYDGLIAAGDELVFQVENKLMPPIDELDTTEIAQFLAWKANNYAEKSPKAEQTDSLVAKMTEVYYRNNLNTMIFEYMLLNVKYFVYQDSLWLQPAGDRAGLETIEVLILEPKKEGN